MILVGIAKNQHDTNMSVWINGKFLYAKCERDSGIKHDPGSMFWVYDKLKSWGICPTSVDGVAFVEFDTYQNYFAPFDNLLFQKQNPYENSLGSCFPNISHDNYFLLDHHYAHYLSNLDRSESAVISDQGGSNFYTSLVLGIKYQKCVRSYHDSSGRLLYHLGLKMNLNGWETDIIGKVMGLHAYGVPIDDFVKEWSFLGRDRVDDLIRWIETLDIDADPQNQNWLNLVSSVFLVGYNWQKQLFKPLPKNTPVTYSGGVALNVNWNRWLMDEGYDLILEPHVYDGGLSIGCVRFLCERFDVPLVIENFPYIQDDEAPTTKPSKETIDKVAELLSCGKIVGWYQGHGELGPRALGNRSILMNPSIKDGKDILNQKVKHREWWRPFGASVKQDKASEYFDLDNSPYMLYTAKVLNSDLHSITHVDGTCRHQTVTPEQNPLFYDLLDAFESKTGLPVLLNTSLNLGGKPIAGKIEEAIELFKTSGMDALCVGNDLYIK